jgi:hypothetical protein
MRNQSTVTPLHEAAPKAQRALSAADIVDELDRIKDAARLLELAIAGVRQECRELDDDGGGDALHSAVCALTESLSALSEQLSRSEMHSR